MKNEYFIWFNMFHTTGFRALLCFSSAVETDLDFPERIGNLALYLFLRTVLKLHANIWRLERSTDLLSGLDLA